MHIDYLIKVFENNRDKTAIIWKDKEYTYANLIERINYWKIKSESNISQGKVVAVEGDFSLESIALILLLIQQSCLIGPLMRAKDESLQKEYLEIAQVEGIFRVDNNDNVKFISLFNSSDNTFYNTLREKSHPGLILFTSGSSGKPKAAVHDFSKLLKKFETPRPGLSMINFLLFDHWGGLNTMFQILSNGGKLITPEDRTPDTICSIIEKHKIEVLPTSPSFLNLLLLSKAYQRYDLNSLKIISYGTEPMPENTLKTLHLIFPKVKLQQTYGLIELGVLRSKSKSSDSLWVKLGGEGFEWRVVDNILQIKAESSMLGYLNAPSPFTEDGWFITGDVVEVDGEYLKIWGRDSEIINVGGEKVFPQEVENVIQSAYNVAEVTVYKEKNPIMGNMVCARVRLKDNSENHKDFAWRIKEYCKERLEPYKVPVRVVVTDETQCSRRFKKIRYRA